MKVGSTCISVLGGKVIIWCSPLFKEGENATVNADKDKDYDKKGDSGKESKRARSRKRQIIKDIDQQK